MSAEELAGYFVTPEEYLAGERISQAKHEYLAGVIYAMAGTTVGHNRIVGNIMGILNTQLRGKACEAFSADIKVAFCILDAQFYYYPDIVIDCSRGANASLFAEQPAVIFEVLSPDTERVDRVEKWRNYQTIPSLQAYVLVDQHHVLVHVHRRQKETWSTEMLVEKTDVLEFPEIGCELDLAAIYERTGL